MGDNISRQAALDAVSYETFECYQARKDIRALPSAEPKTGKCESCKRSSDYCSTTDEDKTRCPIEEHYALPKDGFCHLYEPYKAESEEDA